MRMIFLLAILLPSHVYAADWVKLGTTPEASVMLDKKSIASFSGGMKASLKFIYHKQQPGQNITQGKPFDSSINEYYLVCSAKKYQVLQLTVFYKNEPVGSFHAELNLNDMDQAKPGTGVMFMFNKVCATDKADTAIQK